MNHEHEEHETLITQLSERLINGIFKENPTFVLLLGMCPTLAVTTSAKNGLGMGVTTLAVLALSNLMISALRKVIPDKIRIPAFIVIIASFVTMVELLLEAYIPQLYDNLGIYIPLIVVNCIILGRAEAYAYSHPPVLSLFDGIGMGMGFTFALTIIGAFRELLGSGKIFDLSIMPSGYVPVSIFIMAPGAFFVLAALTAIQNKAKEVGEKKGKDVSKIQSGCGGNCLECDKECKVSFSESIDTKTVDEPVISEEMKVSENSLDKSEKKPQKDKKDNAGKPEKVERTNINKKDLAPESESENEGKKVKDSGIMPGFKDASTNAKVDNSSESDSVKEEPYSEKDSEPATVDKKETSDSNDGIEFLDLNDYMSVIRKANPAVKKTTRKKSSLEKAQAMLSKAEETLKEEEKND